MKLLARLSLVCASLIVMSLWFTGQSLAKIDPKTLVGLWLLNEGKGDQAKDSSEKGNDGTLTNGPKWAAGKFDKALEFSGVKQYVRITSHPSLDPGKGDMSWCAWVKTKAAGNQYVYSNYESGVDRVEFRIQDGKIRLLINDDGGGRTYRDSATTFGDGKWHHVATVWKGSVKKGTIDNYVDAVANNAPYAEQNLTNADVVPLGTVDAIGSRGGTGDFFSGSIDEVAIFNVALSQDDIELLMTKGFEKASAVSPSGKLATTWAKIKGESE